jgi:cyclic-di-AMP phosphodiesterase PgpH
MSQSSSKRSRAERVASLRNQPGRLSTTWKSIRDPETLSRLAVLAVAAVVMWAVTGAWKPPFPYRSGYVPDRAIHARVDFTRPDPAGTEDARRRARAEALAIYANDPQPLLQLRAELKDRLLQLVGTFPNQTPPEGLVQRFFVDEVVVETTLPRLRATLGDKVKLTGWETAVERVFADFEENGLLESMEHPLGDDQSALMNQTAILVHRVGDPSVLWRAESEAVRIVEVMVTLETKLLDELRLQKAAEDEAVMLASVTVNWLRNKGMPITLSLDADATQEARRKAEEGVVEAIFTHRVGDKLAEMARPLSAEIDIPLLELEHRQYVSTLSWGRFLRHSLSDLGMYVAFYALCGAFVVFNAPHLLTDFRAFFSLVLTVVVTVGFSIFAARDWHAEIVPLAMCGMTLAIVYGRELALLVGVALTLVVTLSLGQGIAELVILVAGVASCVLFLGRIRSRTKLITVGTVGGVVSAATAIGVGTYVGQSFASPGSYSGEGVLGADGVFLAMLIQGAGWFGFCTVIAGVIMTGLLPFIEKAYDIQTDLSLLELGDARHPLLQQLAQDAPGTYNHSINIASLAEAAAEAIGANGLLLRVGAYFHDIGKMTQPEYFVENQGSDESRHESLLPAMSTLVIIAHVKDGGDLARQHHLPRTIIDFIEQHHGTTLVEYFYDQASKRSEDDPDTEVDETSFRYPGPKPQTKEAGVMMVADAVESASRTLVDPAPARIESLVHDIVLKRLLDGQFDDCGLTLRELHLIQDSLVKSLRAVYHSRIKYPDQRTA